MTFKDITNRLEEGNLTENEIVEFKNFCAVWLYRINEQYGQLCSNAALWQTAHREDYKSQAECERAWQATQDGQNQTKFKYQIRAIEYISETLSTNWFLKQREWKEAVDNVN